MDKTTKSINLDELKEMVMPEKVCRNCESCVYDDALFECISIDTPVEYISETFIDYFGCNQWQKRNDNQNE